MGVGRGEPLAASAGVRRQHSVDFFRQSEAFRWRDPCRALERTRAVDGVSEDHPQSQIGETGNSRVFTREKQETHISIVWRDSASNDSRSRVGNSRVLFPWSMLREGTLFFSACWDDGERELQKRERERESFQNAAFSPERSRKRDSLEVHESRKQTHTRRRLFFFLSLFRNDCFARSNLSARALQFQETLSLFFTHLGPFSRHRFRKKCGPRWNTFRHFLKSSILALRNTGL